MTYRPHDVPAPTYYRLSDASWDEVRDAYRAGATARELAIRWKVSPSSIYRHACEGGWTKKAGSDAVARAGAAAIAAEEAADLASRQPAGEAFAPGCPPPSVDQMWDRALVDMNRAIAAGRFAEALTLGKLLQMLRTLQPPPAGQDGALDADGEDGAAEGVVQEELEQKLWQHVLGVARGLLNDRPSSQRGYGRAAARWRAENLGPEIARADYEAALQGGWADERYDETGAILPGLE